MEEEVEAVVIPPAVAAAAPPEEEVEAVAVPPAVAAAPPVAGLPPLPPHGQIDHLVRSNITRMYSDFGVAYDRPKPYQRDGEVKIHNSQKSTVSLTILQYLTFPNTC